MADEILDDRISEMSAKLNSVSRSFCLAKWKQTTLHLHIGHKHSCHHPNTHKIPLDLLKDDPSVLHNTPLSFEARKEMKEGIRPRECDYCWRAEDAGSISDRVYKSASDWGKDHFDEVANNNYDYSAFPSYLEISFSNVCQMKCIYCAPQTSSTWNEEVKQHGGYKFKFTTDDNRMLGLEFNDLGMLYKKDTIPIPHREHNPYVEAFWKWWPELYKNLDTFAITGGEPLLSKDTFKVFDYIKNHNLNPELRLSVNSNLCVPEKNWNDFKDQYTYLKKEDMVSGIQLHTSCEAKGAKAEYIRYGLDYNLFLDRIKQYLQLSADLQTTQVNRHHNSRRQYKKASGVNIMCAFNLLSVSSFKEMLEDVVKIKKSIKYSDTVLESCERAMRSEVSKGTPHMITNGGPEHFAGSRLFSFDVPYLRYPNWLSILILTDDFEKYFKECQEYLNDEIWFSDIERQKFDRCYKVFKNTPKHTDHRYRSYFAQYVDELDRRRNTKFLEVFPEYEDFYKLCKTYSKEWTGWREERIVVEK